MKKMYVICWFNAMLNGNVIHVMLLFLCWDFCFDKWVEKMGWIGGLNFYLGWKLMVGWEIFGPSLWTRLNWAHSQMGRGADVTRHVSNHVIGHVNLHVIIAIHIIAKSTATSFVMSSMCDMEIESVMKIILFVTFIFIIENGFGLSFGGPETFYDSFKTSWIKQSMTKI